MSEDVPAGALFRDARDLAKAVLDLYRGGAPLWHLAFLNAAMARARDIEDAHVLFGAYPEERASSVEPALKTASQSHRGRLLTREEAGHIWEARFFPATPLGPTPRPGRAFVQGARLVEALVEFERSSSILRTKEGTKVDWQRLMLQRGFKVLPRRWVERTFSCLDQKTLQLDGDDLPGFGKGRHYLSHGLDRHSGAVEQDERVPCA